MRKGFLLLALSGLVYGDSPAYGSPGWNCAPPSTATVTKTVTSTSTKLEVSTTTCFEVTTETETCTVTKDHTITRADTVFVTATHVETDVVIKPTTVKETHVVVKRTTVEQTETATAIRFRTTAVTVLRPTTLVVTKTTTHQYPVTVTQDKTSVITKLVSSVETNVVTVTSDYPVIATQLVTEPPTTVLKTLTMAGKATTLPGKTITRVVTQITSGRTETITTTTTEAGSVVTQSGAIVLVTPSFKVRLCPSLTLPTGPAATGKSFDINSASLYGCGRGYVCDPPKPDGCNLWPGPPPAGFTCQPEHCVLTPPVMNITEILPGTNYIYPVPGFFNLNPTCFGLPYSVFEYETFVETENGKAVTVTTGDWASQASLTEVPVPPTSKPSTDLSISVGYGYVPAKRKLNYFSKRAVDTAPSYCMGVCSQAYVLFQSVRDLPNVCLNQPFVDQAKQCYDCIQPRGGDISKAIMAIIMPAEFINATNFCIGGGGTTVPTGSSPASDLSGTQFTTSQLPPSTIGSVVPIPTRPTTPSSLPPTVVVPSSTSTSSTSSTTTTTQPTFTIPEAVTVPSTTSTSSSTPPPASTPSSVPPSTTTIPLPPTQPPTTTINTPTVPVSTSLPMTTSAASAHTVNTPLLAAVLAMIALLF